MYPKLAGTLLWPESSDAATPSHDAEELLILAVRWLPENLTLGINSASPTKQQSRYEEALAACSRPSSSTPETTTLTPASAMCTMTWADTRKRWPPSSAIALDPKEAYPHTGLGNVYGNLGRYEEALAAFEQAIALDPKYAYPHNGLGNVYRNLGRYEEALAAFEQAIALDPKLAYPHTGLGNVYRNLGRIRGSARRLLAGHRPQPQISLPAHRPRQCVPQPGPIRGSAGRLQQAIALNPKYAYPHNGLGNVYGNLGRY